MRERVDHIGMCHSDFMTSPPHTSVPVLRVTRYGIVVTRLYDIICQVTLNSALHGLLCNAWAVKCVLNVRVAIAEWVVLEAD